MRETRVHKIVFHAMFVNPIFMELPVAQYLRFSECGADHTQRTETFKCWIRFVLNGYQVLYQNRSRCETFAQRDNGASSCAAFYSFTLTEGSTANYAIQLPFEQTAASIVMIDESVPAYSRGVKVLASIQGHQLASLAAWSGSDNARLTEATAWRHLPSTGSRLFRTGDGACKSVELRWVVLSFRFNTCLKTPVELSCVGRHEFSLTTEHILCSVLISFWPHDTECGSCGMGGQGATYCMALPVTSDVSRIMIRLFSRTVSLQYHLTEHLY
jgi:hypothetical protein